MTLNAIDEWTQRAIPPGSGRYYSILHAETEFQPRLRAITTLISIWSKLCFNSRETEVAQKKIVWWREEMLREHYRHPVTTALQTELKNNPALLSALQSVLEGYSALLDHGSPSTENANTLFHTKTGGQACIALYEVNSQQTQPEVDKSGTCRLLENTGISLSKFRCLRYLHQHTRNGLLCLPLDHLQANNIKPEMLSADSPSIDEVNRYVQKLLQELELQFQQQLQQLAESTGAAKPLYIYLHLQYKLLKLIVRDGGQVLKQETRMTPIRNFISAFAAARKFSKLQAL